MVAHAAAPNRHLNTIRKIKSHVDPKLRPDLQCYHALGNSVADQAANAGCSASYPALTDDWPHQADLRKQEMTQLKELYKLALALQTYRKNAEAHVGWLLIGK